MQEAHLPSRSNRPRKTRLSGRAGTMASAHRPDKERHILMHEMSVGAAGSLPERPPRATPHASYAVR
ncbi:hypothetical protein QF021_000392 [Acidovorax delafieldii]|nr:hypothetical protein [Acidovorax delafieldii]